MYVYMYVPRPPSPGCVCRRGQRGGRPGPARCAPTAERSSEHRTAPDPGSRAGWSARVELSDAGLVPTARRRGGERGGGRGEGGGRGVEY